MKTDLASAAVLVGVIDPLLKCAVPIALVALLRTPATAMAAGSWRNSPFLRNSPAPRC